MLSDVENDTSSHVRRSIASLHFFVPYVYVRILVPYALALATVRKLPGGTGEANERLQGDGAAAGQPVSYVGGRMAEASPSSEHALSGRRRLIWKSIAATRVRLQLRRELLLHSRIAPALALQTHQLRYAAHRATFPPYAA